MIDPLVSLAFSVHSSKGAYALLLGSGVSRAAGIPTGWEVVLDLIRKVASLEGEDCEPDPDAWFRRKHGEQPAYSNLLDAIAKTPAERQQLLRSFFEASEDERAQGLKVPTAAHKAIAQLVLAGYVRVIITTDFDRLVEKALEDVGVAPTVISTPDQVAGTLPLAHSGATIIKLHGDYLDTRLKNTPAELEVYDPRLNELLDQILDEYGLIISGWSAEWDSALRAAIERCPSRRFTTFWAARSPLSGHAKRLAEHRKAEVILIRDANQFFENLGEKVQSLHDLAAPHPLSPKMAVAALKRYLVDEAARIRLRDLVHDETEKLWSELNDKNFPTGASQPSLEDFCGRGRRYEALSETLLALVVQGCHWGSSKQAELWTRTIERIANPAGQGGGYVGLINFRRYPAMLLIYGGGLGATAAGNYETLLGLLTKPRVVESGNHEPLIPKLPRQAVSAFRDASGQTSPIRLNTHFYDLFRDRLKDILPVEGDYRACFDRFEYFLGMVWFDISQEMRWWAGEFAHRHVYQLGLDIRNVVESELAAQGDNCPYLRAGFFGGSVEKMRQLKAKFDVKLSQTLTW